MTASGSGTGHAGGLGGRVALVTGGSGGIGAAIVRQLAAAGAAVAVGYGQHGEAAEKTAAQIVSAGGRAVALRGDRDNPVAVNEAEEKKAGQRHHQYRRDDG